MNATATAPAAQHMRALAQANRVRLARAELKRQVAEGETSVADVVLDVPVGGREHDDQRPADESAPLGAYSLPQVPRVDPHVGDQDDRLDDRSPAPTRSPRMLAGDPVIPRPRARVEPRAELSSSECAGGRGRYVAAPPALARSPGRASRSRRCDRRDRAGRSSGTLRGRRRRCTPRPGRAGSRATPPARRPSRRSARSGASSRRRPRPSGSSGYSMKLRARRARRRRAPNHTWRVLGIVVRRPVVHDRQPEQVAVERDRPLQVAARSASGGAARGAACASARSRRAA